MNERDFFGADSFLANTDLVEQITKALTAGYGYEGAPGALAGGGALQVESLDNTLKAVTWSYKHLRIWPVTPKDKAFNTVEQFNRQDSYGEQQDGGFFDAEAGAPPAEHDASFTRDFQKVRYLGTTRQVTHPLTLVRTAHAPAVALQIKGGTMWLLEQQERQLFMANGLFQDAATGNYTGNAASLPAASLKYNGIDQQVRSGQSNTKTQYSGWDGYGEALVPVKDVNGAVPDEDDITDWAYIQATNFGVPDIAFWPLKALYDVSRTMLPKERVVPPGQEGRGGFVMTEFIAASGVFKMAGSKFLEPRRGARNVGENARAANMPILDVGVPTAVEADATSQLVAGDYYYRVSAVNQFGESAACAEAHQAVLAGQRVVINIDQPLAADGTMYYTVYRSSVTGGGWEFIGCVARAAAPGDTQFRDAGRMQPGLGHAYLMQMDADNYVWRQLAPLMKMDLAIVSPAYRWMQLLYGTPIIFASLHNSIMDNIGRA